MSSRRITRSSKQQGQTLTDHFLPSRGGGYELPGKSLGDESSSVTSRAKRTLNSSYRLEVPLDEVQVETISVKTEKPVGKSRSTRALFGAVPKKDEKKTKEEPVQVEVKEKVVEPVRSIIPTEADIEAAKSSDGRKPRWADLQSGLKGAAKIHEQRKLDQLDERVACPKSPQKMLQTVISGGSPPKKAKKERKGSKKRAPSKVLPTPDFVLPTRSIVEATSRPEREKSGDRETGDQEDSVTRAPKGYCSTLLNDEVKMSVNIRLPTDYSELHEVFHACENIVSIFESTRQTLTLSKLSKAAMRQLRKELTMDRFSQLVAVYPQAYKVEVEHIGDGMTGSPRWEHVIKPNHNDDISSFVNDSLVLEKPSMGARLNARYQIFRSLLARRVIEAHDKFVVDRELDSSFLSSFSSFSRDFHKDFDLNIDSICPSIEKADIGQIPERVAASDQGTGDLAKIFSKPVAVPPKEVDEAIVEHRSPEKKTVSSSGLSLSPATPKMSLLNMVRARNAAEAAAKKRRNPELEAKMDDLDRLVNQMMLDFIFKIYRSDSRTSITVTKMKEAMIDNDDRRYRLKEDKASSLLIRLTSLVPGHFTIAKTIFGEFFKVAPDNSHATFEIVDSILKKELESCKSKSVSSFRAR